MAASVGFVGPGRMGFPMVERLIAAGHAVTCHARRPEVAAAAVLAGATGADTTAEAVRDVDVAIVCLYDNVEVRALCAGPGRPHRRHAAGEPPRRPHDR